MAGTPRILVIGCGAIGGVIAAALSRVAEVSGYDTNAAHVAAIRDGGLRVSGEGPAVLARFAVTDDAATLADQRFDAAVFLVKSGATAAAAAALGPALSGRPVLLTLQNGMGNAEALADVPGLLARGVTMDAGRYLGPGRVERLIHGQPTWFGPARPGPVEPLLLLAGIFRAAGLPAEVLPDPMRAVWAKFVFNAVMNPIGALLLGVNAARYEVEAVRTLIDEMAEECLAVVRALGGEVAFDPMDTVQGALRPGPAVAPCRFHGARHRPRRADGDRGPHRLRGARGGPARRSGARLPHRLPAREGPGACRRGARGRQGRGPMIRRRQVAGLLGGLAAGPARAQAWPDRPVRIIVPYAPGGANDILARLYGQKLGGRLGQPFVVENRPGAQAIIGTEAAARAQPDGQTLLLGASGPIVFNPATYATLPYDPLRDLAPVSLLASFPLVLVAAAASPHRSVAELVAWARANPQRANYGASGAGFQLPTELFNQRAGTRFQYVAYRGSAESVNAAANGEVTIALVDTGPASVAIAAGRARALAVAAPDRVAAYPDVPTMAELGFPDVQATLWSGLFAPAATPRSILDRLQRECEAITALPEIRTRLAGLAMESGGLGPDGFRALIAREIGIWTAVARTAGIQLER